MNNKAKVVIGMGFGDEGKGMTVNHLIKDSFNPVVVRFSGGQQAGHTVHVGSIKHICSNFGSGVLMGVPSYWSEHTTFYPVTIAREIEVLKSKGILNPKLIIHPLAKITTPWDVWNNRNDNNNLSHGTCGLGIGATMHRHIAKNITLTAIDLMHLPTLEEKVKQIALKSHFMFDIPVWFQIELDEFWIAVKSINWVISDYDHLLQYDEIIFEGSQGVLLDMDHGSFPNVTYANTTSKNAIEICKKLKIDPVIYCVIRAYHTRHGNGYFHDDFLELKDTHHETNVTNEYQGEFKISRLDYKLLDYASAIERLYSKDYPHILMVTCCNQVSMEDRFNYKKLKSDWNDIQESHTPYGEFKKIK